MSKLDYNKIKNLAASKRIPIKELARRCDLSEQGFHYMLKKQTMRVDTLERICEALEVSPFDLFGSMDGSTTELNALALAQSSQLSNERAEQLMHKLDIIIDLLRLQKIG